MTRNGVRMVLTLAVVLSLPALALADGGTCSGRELVGAWGYTETGSAITPNGPVVSAAVGRYTFERDGTFSGTQYSSVNGVVRHDIKRGTYTLNADCTGTLVLQVYNQEEVLQRNSTWAIVMVENGNALRGIMLELLMVTPVGEVSIPPILTLEADRMVPGRAMSDPVAFTLGQEPKSAR